MSLSICFVAPNAYGVLSGDTRHCHVGGAEVQQVLVARGLAASGHQVSFITLDHGQEDGCQFGNIRVLKMYSPGGGLPGLRMVHPKWTGLAGAMRRANADVYYQRTCGIETGQVCLWCRRHDRPFIFGVGSDRDCEQDLSNLENPLERWFYRYGLRHANAVIAQTQSQRGRLMEGFGRSSVVIPSCRPVLGEDLVVLQPPPPGPPHILWVGRFSPIKRPEWCLELAARCPQLSFDMVGASNIDSAYARSIAARAAGLPNVRLHGYVPYDRMGSFYAEAMLLLSTSLYEGFPNTFLEAWSYGRPVVGTVDPDGVVLASSLGAVAEDLDGLAKGLGDLLADRTRWLQASQAAYHYVIEHHSLEATVTAYEGVLAGLGAQNPA